MLNHFPVLTAGSNPFVSAGNIVSLTSTAVDEDGDTLRLAWFPTTAPSQWLFGWMLKSVFPSAGGNSFTAPSLARTATVPYDVSVADGRGGSDQRRNYVTVEPASNSGQPPSGTLTVSPTDAPAGVRSRWLPATDPDAGQVFWDLWAGMKGGTTGACCFAGASTTLKLNNPGVYRIGAQAIDRALDLSTRQSVVVRIGGATGEPPIASATIDKLSDTVPMTANIDMSASVNPDGSIRNYYVGCGDTGLVRSRNPLGSCTFTTPGAYWIRLLVEDNSGLVDVISAYVVATPGR